MSNSPVLDAKVEERRIRPEMTVREINARSPAGTVCST